MTYQRARQIIAAVRQHGVPLPSQRTGVVGFHPTGDFTMPVFAWPQIGVSLIVGLGLGYVFFARK